MNKLVVMQTSKIAVTLIQ